LVKSWSLYPKAFDTVVTARAVKIYKGIMEAYAKISRNNSKKLGMTTIRSMSIANQTKTIKIAWKKAHDYYNMLHKINAKKEDAYIQRKSHPMIAFVEAVLTRSRTEDRKWSDYMRTAESSITPHQTGVIRMSSIVKTSADKALGIIHIRIPDMAVLTIDNFVNSSVLAVTDLFTELTVNCIAQDRVRAG
jgi:hypothetical protein